MLVHRIEPLIQSNKGNIPKVLHSFSQAVAWLTKCFQKTPPLPYRPHKLLTVTQQGSAHSDPSVPVELTRGDRHWKGFEMLRGP